MREIKSALVVGAGAVGAAVAGIIHQREPGAASVLAGGERLARIRRDGFVLNGRRVDFPLVEARAGAAPADLVLVAVKCHQLAAAIEDMRPFVGPDTLVLSLLNGITSEDDLAAAFGREKVPYAMIIGIDAMRDGNSTVFASSGRINFGEARNVPGAWTERVSRIASFFDRTGVAYVVPEDMIRTLWFKFMVNVGVNQASAVLRAPYGPFQSLPEAKAAMEAPMREVVALSRALGTGLTDRDVDAWYGTLLGLSAEAKTSMLQDVEAGRKTEVEAFAGTVVALARKAGVDVPVNAYLLDLIRAMEGGYGVRADLP